MAWITGGEFNNPADAAVLADTGPIPGGGDVSIKIVITATTAMMVLVQHRNAVNNVTVEQFRMKVPPNDTRSVDVGSLTLAGNERVRVLQEGAIAGRIQAMIVTN